MSNRFSGWTMKDVEKKGKTLCKCKQCGTEFFISNSYLRRDGKRLYCSNDCKSMAMKNSGNHRYKATEGLMICKSCDKEFKVKPTSKLNNKSKVYCSAECREKKIGFKAVKCFECGNDLKLYPSQIKDKNFCSQSCSSKYYYRQNNQMNNGVQRGRGGKRIDLNNQYFRSSWEANYARYLNFLIENNEIKKWEYEVDTFEFHKIKKGTRFYTPDFKILLNNGVYEYHEVKGWLDKKSITRQKRMDKYYPQIRVILIDKKWFRRNGKELSKIIKNWELSGINGKRIY